MNYYMDDGGQGLEAGRVLFRLDEREVLVASYYAPPGVAFGYKKVEKPLAFGDV